MEDLGQTLCAHIRKPLSPLRRNCPSKYRAQLSNLRLLPGTPDMESRRPTIRLRRRCGLTMPGPLRSMTLLSLAEICLQLPGQAFHAFQAIP